MHVIGVVFSMFVIFDVVFTLAQVFRKRSVTVDGARESAGAHWRRVARTMSPHLVVWGLIIGAFWAIVHFGPLRPVHEWFR